MYLGKWWDIQKFNTFTLLVLLFFFWRLKKSSENDKSIGHFQSFCFLLPDPKSENKSRKSTYKDN